MILKNIIYNFRSLLSKKYLSLVGGFLVYVGLGAILSIPSVTAPYYMSYMQVRTKSKDARYPNTVYILNITLVFNALSSICSGVLKNRFTKFTFKQMHYVAIVLLTYVSLILLTR